MINAIEAHKLTEKNNTRKDELRNIVENVLPFIDESIRVTAGYGVAGLRVSREEVMAKAPRAMFFTKKEILDAVIEELRGFGFKAEATPSYTSIHIEW